MILILINSGDEKMADYQKMYSTLFNEITDVIEKLKQAQQKTEDIYIEEGEKDNIIIIKPKLKE